MEFGIDILKGRNLIADFDHLPDTVKAIIRSKLPDLLEDLEQGVLENIDSRFKSGTDKTAQGLYRLIREERGVVEGIVGIRGVPYARIQDRGGVIPPHIIRPKNGKILAFIAASGAKVFATQVSHPGGTIPATHFFKDAYRDRSTQISTTLKRAVIDGIRQQMRQGV